MSMGGNRGENRGEHRVCRGLGGWIAGLGSEGGVRLRGRTGCQKVDGERVWQREGGMGEREGRGGEIRARRVVFLG